jgi:hypothetical protein
MVHYSELRSIMSMRNWQGRKGPVQGALVGLMFAALAVAQAQVSEEQALPSAPGRSVVSLTPDPGGFHTPSIAVNPSNSQQLVVGFQSKTRVAYSADGGAHWAIAPGTAPTEYRVTGDTSITYDRQGHAILCFIAHDGAGPFKYWGNKPKRNAILIRRSLDGGRTWEPHAIPVIEHSETPGIPFEDKPYIVADNHSGSRFGGNLYVGWSQDRMADALIVLARSTDGGMTWSAPVRVSDRAGLPRDDNGTVEGFSGVVTPDGALHAVWSDTNHVVYAVSRDGGRSFSRNRWIADTAPSHFVVLNASEANGYPQIAMMAGRNGSHPRLYVGWSDYRNGDVDVFCISSLDGGRSWGPAVRVNSDPVHNAADQLFQWLAVDPTSGAVNLIFYDRRRDPANRSADVVLARSTDGARTFRNYLLSDHSFDPMGGSIGEYTALAAVDGRIFGSWTEIVGSQQAGGGRGRPSSVIRFGTADFGRPGTPQGPGIRRELRAKPRDASASR